MKLKSVEFRNFNSYGNRTQKIEFDESGDFYLVVGDNGSGKSSISDVIKFGIYGKVGNKKLGDLPNRHNKALFVRTTLEKNKKTDVVIERGVAPSYVRLLINGKEYDQAGKKNVEQYIEDEIIGMPFYVFNNIISLSINDFKSFLNMSSHDKRMIVDKIFGLEIINSIRFLIREELKNTKNNIYLLDKEVKLLDQQLTEFNNEIGNLEKTIKTDHSAKKVLVEKRTEEIKKSIEKINSSIDSLVEKENEYLEKINKFSEALSSTKNKKQNIDQKKKLYENDKCPTCGSLLDTDEHKEIYKSLIENEKKVQANFDKINSSLLKLRDVREKISTRKNQFGEKKTELRLIMGRLDVELRESKNHLNNSKTMTFIKKQVESTGTRKTNTFKKKDVQTNKHNFFKIIDEIFGDKGVKQLALQKILPTLNVEIKKVLINMGMTDYQVKFDTEFNPKIVQLGHNVSVSQLSTGEKKKIDFAILIALIRLLKMKNPGMNLIFLDEIFSSIDPNGIFHILEILKNSTKELNLNVFVINFSPLPSELFDYRVDVEKLNNFSNLKVEKIN